MLLRRKREKEGKGKTKALCRVPSTEPRKARRCTRSFPLQTLARYAAIPPHHSDDHGHGCAMRAVMATAARKRATVVARRSVESNGGIRPGNAGRKKVYIAFSITCQITPSNQKPVLTHWHYTTMSALSILSPI